MFKTLVIISDLHCGSVFGLTPPAYYEAERKRRAMQKEAWKAYRRITQKWQAPDVLLVNGDCIEGTQKLQGGAELTTPDRNVQCEMATEAISLFNAKKILISYGSKYHVGEQAEDFEYPIAKSLKARVGGRLFFRIEGVVFDARHKVGGSGSYQNRASGISREVLWNLIKEANSSGPKVDCVIRSHVHYHTYVEIGERMAFSTPCLQLARGRFGSRECVGEVHWGAVRLTISKGKIVNREVEMCKLRSNIPKLMRLG